MKEKDKLKFFEFLEGKVDGKKTYPPLTTIEQIKEIKDKLDSPREIMNIIVKSIYMVDEDKLKIAKYYVSLRSEISK